MIKNANIKNFGFIMLSGMTVLMMSSVIYQWIMHLTSNDFRAVLFYPFLSMQDGYYLVPVSSLAVTSFLFIACVLIGRGRLSRFIGFQVLYALAAIVVATSITVLIYGYLFEGLNGFVPLPQYIFSAIEMNKHLGDSNLLWATLMAFSLVGAAYGIYIFKVFFNLGQPLGKARFANGFDIYKAGLYASQGFVLSKSIYGQLKFAGYEPIIFVSGTGGGKTKAVVIPNMFELRNENIVVTDIKGEVYGRTHAYRRSIGSAVYRFEPASKGTHCYNPLGLVRQTHLDEDLDSVFKTLIPDSHDPIWSDGSRNIAKMLAMYDILEQHKTPTLQHIYQTLCAPNFMESSELMYESVETPRIRHLLGKFLSAREKTRRDLLLNAQEYLSKFDSPRLAYATSTNDFDFRDLRKKPMTIYLVMPPNTDTFGTICALFFEQMIRLTTEKNEPDADEYSINAIIDELANLPKMPSIAQGVSFLRSYRIRICAFVQHISQLKAVYGDNNKESFMAAPIKVAFNVTSKSDAEYFSSLAGKKTIKVSHETLRSDMSMNISTHKHYRDLLTANEVMRLHSSRLLIYRTGFYVIKGKKNFWFKHREYKRTEFVT